MKFSVLASGSRGNCTIVETADRRILVDLGLGPRVLARQLALVGRTTDQITDVFITHEHSDHISGLEHFCRRNPSASIYATAGTRNRLPEKVRARCGTLSANVPLQLGHTEILPIALSHDAAEPVGYRIGQADMAIGLITDLGRYDDWVLGPLTGVSNLVVEANHDCEMLARGPYPGYLKTRIAGPRGHLSNAQCAGLVAKLAARQGPLDVTLAHISETNNSEEHLLRLGNRLREQGANRVRTAPRRSTSGFVVLSGQSS